MTAAYYNEIDPQAAQWLRELIAAGLIPVGVVDDRSIEDVQPNDLAGFTQCHFFAGIGGWSYALRLAGWPDDHPVWTGSCPCQPFSTAGKGKGFDDERHLWPAWFWLIEQCRPHTIFGEQVGSKDGRDWFDLVSTDLEGSGYACGSAATLACGVGAPHKRQRLYWVADSEATKRWSATDTENDGRGLEKIGGPSVFSDVADGIGSGLEGQPRDEDGSHKPGRLERDPTGSASPGGWAVCDWLPCRDGKSRPVEPGTFPLAHGVPGRVGLLRGYGNAIVPQQAQAFIEAYMEATL